MLPGMHVTTHQKFPLLVAYFDVFGESSLTRYFALLLLFGILATWLGTVRPRLWHGFRGVYHGVLLAFLTDGCLEAAIIAGK